MIRKPNTSSLPSEPSEATLFTVQEMRYFHHFLTRLNHPLPLGNGSIWLKEIPQISHTHPFLLHAMLALGVSELGRTNGLRVSTEVLKHRGQAIAGLQKALDDTASWTNYGHVDAILGTLYILVYQSSHMPDGAQDFETFAHGCALTTSAIQEGGLRTVLNVAMEWPEQKLSEALHLAFPDTLPETDLIFIQSGIQLLNDLQPAAAASVCYPFWHALNMTSTQFCEWPRQAYISSFKSFGKWFFLSPVLLSALRKPSDSSLAVIFIAIFLANMTLCHVLIPMRMWAETAECPHGPPWKTLQQIAQWIEAIYQTVPEAEQGKLTRPKIIVEMFPDTPAIVRDKAAEEWKVEILNDLGNKAHMIVGDILRLGSDVSTWFEEALLAKYRAQKVSIK